MTALPILAEADLDWVTDAIDIVEQSVDRPWRDALERLDDLQRAAQPTSPRRFSSVVGALQRVAGGRATHAQAAREARELVLGHPVFGAIERQARLSAAAEQLGVTIAALEARLWSDVPRERPVELPRGRPSELEVAAFANVALIQRSVRRAQHVTLRTTGDAGPILRTCARFGLLATATVDGAGAVAIDIVGPLALFHRTAVYGKALADLVPLLGELRQFTLELSCETKNATFETFVSSPVLLPVTPARLAAPSRALARLTRELARAAPGLAITAAPPVLVCPAPIGVVLTPDLRIAHGGRTTYVELVTFWTAAYVQRKLASYQRAGIDVILCLDAAGGCDECDVPTDGVLFRRRVGVEQILEGLAGKWGTLWS